MQETNSDYIHILKEAFSRRQKANEHYSLRAYARDLKVHPSTLSLIMKGKRRLPVKNLKDVARALNLSPMKEGLFRESLYRTKAKLDDIEIKKEYQERFLIDETHYNVIAEWEYYAVLSLVETKEFEPNYEFISKRLGITLNRAEVVLQGLVQVGLLKKVEGKYILTKAPLRTTEDISSSAIKKSHIETLDIGKKKLDEVDIELRDFSSMTIAVNTEKMMEAKTIIREFRQKMASLLRDGEETEVYQLAIQFYPLTKENNEEQVYDN